jgi:hypothetical protein
MTDEVSRARAKSRAADRTAILIGAVVVLVGAVAAYLFFAGRSSGSSTMSVIRGDVKGQLQTQDVSCRKIGFSVPSLTRQQIYACDAKNVTLYNRPRGHIKDSAFTRCYIQSVGGQTVDVSHAISIEAKIRGKTVPCR